MAYHGLYSANKNMSKLEWEAFRKRAMMKNSRCVFFTRIIKLL